MEVIAKSRRETTTLWPGRFSAAAMVLSAILLSGCVGGRYDLAAGLNVDRSLKTGSVPGSSGDRISDEATVRNAVSSLDLARYEGDPIPWANSASGSAGVISRVAETRDGAGTLCRDFTTTRHSYRGVSSYRGRACMTRAGDWALVHFEQQT